MYGTVEWCNVSDSLGKVKKGTELESTVFVFKSGVVFLCRERLKRRKSKAVVSKIKVYRYTFKGDYIKWKYFHPFTQGYS